MRELSYKDKLVHLLTELAQKEIDGGHNFYYGEEQEILDADEIGDLYVAFLVKVQQQYELLTGMDLGLRFIPTNGYATLFPFKVSFDNEERVQTAFMIIAPVAYDVFYTTFLPYKKNVQEFLMELLDELQMQRHKLQ